MKVALALLISLLFSFSRALALPSLTRDTTETEKRPKPYSVRLTARLHTMGAFYYSGRIISKNPALDFFFVYERKSWSFFYFKAFDLYDHLTPNNFSLAAFYKSFHFGKRFIVTPYAGVTLEQNHSVADRGSDVTAILITAFKVTKNFTIDNSCFFSNLVLEPHEKDWVNRLRILYTSPHVDATVYAWHNNRVFGNTDYFSGGFNLTYARIKVSKNLLLSTGVTGLAMFHTSDETLFPKRNGMILTVSALIN